MALSEFIAASSGATGAAFSTVVLYPIEVLKTNMNKGSDHNGVKYKGALDVVQRVLADHGTLGFYSGLTVRTTHQTVQKFSFYYMYDALRRLVRALLRSQKLGFWPNLLVGYLSGVGTVFVSSPLEVVSTRQQLCAKSTSGSEAPGLAAVFARMANEEGIGVFYRGMVANVILAINPAIENTVFDQVRTWFLRRAGESSLSAAQAFWLGALAKIVATLLTFPYIRAKVIMQSAQVKGVQLRGDSEGAVATCSEERLPSTLQVLGRIAREDGVLALWAGMAPQATKAVLASAVLLAAKEKIELFVRAAVLSVAQKQA